MHFSQHVCRPSCSLHVCRQPCLPPAVLMTFARRPRFCRTRRARFYISDICSPSSTSSSSSSLSSAMYAVSPAGRNLYPVTCLSGCYPIIGPSVRRPVGLSVSPSACTSVRPAACLSTHQSAILLVCQSISHRPPILPMHLSEGPPIHLSIQPSVRPLTRPSVSQSVGPSSRPLPTPPPIPPKPVRSSANLLVYPSLVSLMQACAQACMHVAGPAGDQQGWPGTCLHARPHTCLYTCSPPRRPGRCAGMCTCPTVHLCACE